MKYVVLDKDEKQILDDFESDRFVEITNANKLKVKYAWYAKKALNNDKTYLD